MNYDSEYSPTPKKSKQNVSSKKNKLVRSVSRRGAARLSAIQALYQMDIAGTGLIKVIEEYKLFRFGQELDGIMYIKPDPVWFDKIVSGVVMEQKILDPIIHNALHESWPLSRLDMTIRAILRAGTFELKNERTIELAIIVSEYIELAKAFFGEGSDQAKLVNSVLDRIGKEIRSNT